MYKLSLIVSIVSIILSGQSARAYNGTCPSGCECNYVSVNSDNVISSGLTGVSVNGADANEIVDASANPISVWVECSRLKPRLEALPPRVMLPENIFALDVTLNDIETLDIIDSMESLTWFSISGNELRSLSRETFNNVPNLRYLDLKENNISELPEGGVFDALKNLEILDLSDNKLRHLPVDGLKFNTKLRKLNLASNPLRIIHPEWFQNLNSLNELNLAKTELLTLLPDTFKFTPNLEKIDLSKNLMKSVPSFALKLARNLEILKFSENLVEKINEESFAQLLNLREIEINFNPHLIEIQLRSFYNLNQLKILKIEHNPDLSHLDSKAFIGMSHNKTNSNLEELSLAGNRFSTLPRYSLNWCNLKSLDLRENPWKCDCNLEWTRNCPNLIGNPKLVFFPLTIFKKIQNSSKIPENSKFQIFNSKFFPRCATPSNLRGVILFHVPKEEFGCEQSDLAKDGSTKDEKEPLSSGFSFGHQRDSTEQKRDVKFMIMLCAVMVLFFLGLAIAIIVKKSASAGHRVKHGSGNIYYTKTSNTDNNNGFVPDLI